jgi:hypothetical protein
VNTTTAAVPRTFAPGALVVAWFVALVVVVLVVVLALSGSSSGSVQPSRHGNELVATHAGGVTVRGGTVEVANSGGNPVILNMGIAPFDAASIGFVIVDAQPLPPGAEVALLWVQRAHPGDIREQIVKLDGRQPVPTPLADNPDWQGQIASVALGVKTPTDESVVIREVDLRRATLALTLRDVAGDWMHFAGWNGKSINVVFGGRDEQRVYLPPLAACAALVACAALAFYARRRRASIGIWLAIPFIASWMLLDVRWQSQLVSQVRETHAAFAGKTPAERHAAMEHPAFFALVEAAASRLPPGRERVFVTSDFDYFRLRAGYYLYPHNVLAYDWADPSALHPGDYLLMFAKSDVKFDAAKGALEWSGGRRVPARALIPGDGQGLYEIL